MNPLAVEIWCSIVVAYFFVSIAIWIIGRFTPLEWKPYVVRSGLQEVCETHNTYVHHEIDENELSHCVHGSSDLLVETRNSSSQGYNVDLHECQGIHHPHNHNGFENFHYNLDESDGEGDTTDVCDHDENEIELISIKNEFTLKNSFWFSCGTFLQQGSDLNPVVCFFFLLLFVSDFFSIFYIRLYLWSVEGWYVSEIYPKTVSFTHYIH